MLLIVVVFFLLQSRHCWIVDKNDVDSLPLISHGFLPEQVQYTNKTAGKSASPESPRKQDVKRGGQTIFSRIRTDLGTDSGPHPVHCRLIRCRSNLTVLFLVTVACCYQRATRGSSTHPNMQTYHSCIADDDELQQHMHALSVAESTYAPSATSSLQATSASSFR